MEVNNNVNATTTTAANPAAYTSAASSTAAENTTQNTNGATVGEAAVYEPSSKNQVYKPDTEKIKQMIEESNQKSEQFRMLVERLLNKQGSTAKEALGGFNNMEDMLIPIDEQTRRKAQEAIDEGGYYSVENTSERILDFAKALSGGDPAKIETLKDAFKKGFKQAEGTWGGKLPDISQKTYDAVMKGFDEWEKASKTTGEAVI